MFVSDCKIVVVNGSVSAGTTSVTPTAPVDTAGFRKAAFAVLTGDVSDGCKLAVELFGNSVNAIAGAVAIPNSKVEFTANATNADNRVLISEVARPQHRYVYPVVTRGTANAALNGIVAVLHDADKLPVQQKDVIAFKESAQV